MNLGMFLHLLNPGRQGHNLRCWRSRISFPNLKQFNRLFLLKLGKLSSIGIGDTKQLSNFGGHFIQEVGKVMTEGRSFG
jgi:hypothetical protein